MIGRRTSPIREIDPSALVAPGGAGFPVGKADPPPSALDDIPNATARQATEAEMMVQIHELVPVPAFVKKRKADGHIGNLEIRRRGPEDG